MTGREAPATAREPSPDAVLALDPEGLLRALPGLPDDLNAVLRLADGRRTVREIVEASGRPDGEVSGSLVRLLDCGALRVANPGTPAPEAAEWFVYPADPDPERPSQPEHDAPAASPGLLVASGPPAAPGPAATPGPAAASGIADVAPGAGAPAASRTIANQVAVPAEDLDADAVREAVADPAAAANPVAGRAVVTVAAAVADPRAGAVAGPGAEPPRTWRSRAWLAVALAVVAAAVALGIRAGSEAAVRPEAAPAPSGGPPAQAMAEPRTRPGAAEALARARERLAAGDLVTAAKACRQAIEAEPASGPAWALLGEIHLAAGDTGRARAALERSLAVDPSGPAAPAARAALERLRP